MKKPKIIDEKALECAEIIKEYCKSHESCFDECVFSQVGSHNACKLDDTDPEHWQMKKDDKNE